MVIIKLLYNTNFISSNFRQLHSKELTKKGPEVWTVTRSWQNANFWNFGTSNVRRITGNTQELRLELT